MEKHYPLSIDKFTFENIRLDFHLNKSQDEYKFFLTFQLRNVSSNDIYIKHTEIEINLEDKQFYYGHKLFNEYQPHKKNVFNFSHYHLLNSREITLCKKKYNSAQITLHFEILDHFKQPQSLVKIIRVNPRYFQDTIKKKSKKMTVIGLHKDT